MDTPSESLKSRHLTVSYTQPDSRSRVPQVLLPMPFLRLRGRWLDTAGFTIGSEVRVQVSAGRLVLDVLNPCEHRADRA